MNTLRRIPLSILVFVPALLLAACGASVYYVRPPEWTDIMTRDSVVASMSDAFRGVVIFVDPGHGGDEPSVVGPSGDLREADLNLRVAMRLREYLKRAGANVIMSRESDVAVPVDARAQQANLNKADIFLSIHHNSAPDLQTDYTTTIYHSRPGMPGYQPSSHDLARYIQRDLSYALGNSGPLTTFDGTISDHQLSADKGLASLRDARMTAVLVECAFLTSAYEERRLKLPEFNDIEAWGIFRGIARYLKAGIPSLKYASPVVFDNAHPTLEILATDRTGILDESIRAFVDGREEGFTYDRKSGRIAITVSRELSRGYHILTAQARNLNENSAAPFSEFFAIGDPPALLRQTTEPPVIPPDPRAYSIVAIRAVDTAGVSMPDGLPIRVVTSEGLDTTIALVNGEALLTIGPGKGDRVGFEASNGPIRTEGAIAVTPGAPYTRGIIMSADGKVVPNASITMSGSNTVFQTRQGEYILGGSKIAGLEALVEAPGYFARREAFTENIAQDPIVLSPIAKGVLLGKRVLLDLRPPEIPATRTGDIDGKTIADLQHLLRVSGAIVDVLPTGAAKKKERQAMLAAAPDATVLQIGVKRRAQKIAVIHGGPAAARATAECIARALPQYSEFAVQPPAPRAAVRDEFERMKLVTVLIPSSDRRAFDEVTVPRLAWGVAWGAYAGLLAQEGYKTKGARTIEVKVADKKTRQPAPNVEVELNHTLRGITDTKGTCVFRAVSIQEDDLRVLEPDRFEITGVKTDAVN